MVSEGLGATLDGYCDGWLGGAKLWAEAVPRRDFSMPSDFDDAIALQARSGSSEVVSHSFDHGRLVEEKRVLVMAPT